MALGGGAGGQKDWFCILEGSYLLVAASLRPQWVEEVGARATPLDSFLTLMVENRNDGVLGFSRETEPIGYAVMRRTGKLVA